VAFVSSIKDRNKGFSPAMVGRPDKF